MYLTKDIYNNTESFIAEMSKKQRKEYGQFFTVPSTADYMASLVSIDYNKQVLSILDAGAGSGVLSAAIVAHIREHGYTGDVELTCYETDFKVLPLLRENLTQINDSYQISYNIITENYILSQKFGSPETESLYDIIIGNPPYKKIAKNAEEALAIPEVCYGAPNLYFLFWAMAIHNLKPGGEIVYIIPRSWTSGAYFAKFREYLFSQCVITHLHLFDSRDKVFDGESVLQETIIVKVKKTTIRPKSVCITSSSTSDFLNVRKFDAPYNVVVSNRQQYVFLVTDGEESVALDRLSHLDKTLPSISLPMKTGIIVDFRNREVLRNESSDATYPLFYSQHIKNGRVVWPVGKEDEHICTDRIGFLQDNTNYFLVKRFTAKEEKRRLQCGIYLQSDHPEYAHISTQNKVNFIKCETPELAYGLFVLMNSSIYDTYYRILNGSTQVNSTEINNMPVPDIDIIAAMGRQLMGQELTVSNCNTIIEQWIR